MKISLQLLYRQIENVALSVIDADPVLSRRLTSLSLWMSLQTLGRDAIGGRITVAFECCRMFHEIISKCRGLRVLVRAAVLFYHLFALKSIFSQFFRFFSLFVE